jgi:drug/metabolite transporter (DMT)-like permease
MPFVRAPALLALHAAVALFGFAGLFGKWLALPAIAIVLGRTLVAASALALIARAQRIATPASAGLALNGVILAIHWTAFFHAIQIANVATGLLGFASFPLFVVLLETVSGRRRIRARHAATATAVTLGLVVLVPEFDWRDRTVQGLMFGLVSGLTFALLAIRGRALVRERTAIAIALWQNAFAALALLPVAAWSGALGGRAPTRAELVLIVVLGVFCTALAHTLFIASMRRLSAHVASVVAALEPVYGIALAAALLGEMPSLRTVAGATLIVGAALYVSTADARGPQAPAPS